jgi:hypothetical protein
MSVEVRHSGKSMQQRIDDRLKSSGDPRADVVTKHGEGARRTYHHVHFAGHVYDKSTAIQPNDGQTQRGYPSATQQTTSYTPQDKGRGR